MFNKKFQKRFKQFCLPTLSLKRTAREKSTWLYASVNLMKFTVRTYMYNVHYFVFMLLIHILNCRAICMQRHLKKKTFRISHKIIVEM